MPEQPVYHLPTDRLNEESKKEIVEQYKLLIDSINHTNTTRENSNNFWMAVNGICLSGVAYIKDLHVVSSGHKCFLMYTLVFLGILLCFSWISFLYTIKKTIQVRTYVLLELEKYFPVHVFSKVFNLTHRQEEKTTLTINEMLVPIAFLFGYFMFAAMLYFLPEEIVAPTR